LPFFYDTVNIITASLTGGLSPLITVFWVLLGQFSESLLISFLPLFPGFPSFFFLKAARSFPTPPQGGGDRTVYFRCVLPVGCCQSSLVARYFVPLPRLLLKVFSARFVSAFTFPRPWETSQWSLFSTALGWFPSASTETNFRPLCCPFLSPPSHPSLALGPAGSRVVSPS